MDRRVYPRFAVQLSGAFTEDSRARQGMVADISVGGRKSQSDVQMPPGSSKFKILLPEYKGLMTVDRAVVRWCRDSAMGIEFIRMVPEQQAVLRRSIEQLQKLCERSCKTALVGC